MELVNLGKYKIAFWDPNSPDDVHSEMFDNLSTAQLRGELVSGQGQIFIIMENTAIGDYTYSWRLVPGGMASYFRTASRLYEWRWLLLMGSLGVWLVWRRVREP